MTSGRPAPRRSVWGSLAIRLVRLWFGVAGRLAPRTAERSAAALMLTPRRRTAREPLVPGLVARRHTFEADGHRVAGWSWGEGPTVILLHGWSGLAADLTTAAAALVRAGFRVVAIDWPAHGRSPGRRTDLVEWTGVLLSLGEELGARDGGLHAVIGHSFGATAVALALEAGLAVRGAVLLAPARGPGHVLERTRHFIGLPEARVAGMERRIVERVGRDLAFYDAARAAALVRLPALILHDPADPEIPWAHAEAIASAWHGSSLVRAEGEGHYQILNSQRVIERVVAFVHGLSTAG